MCVAMHGVRLEGTSGRRNNLAKLVECGMKNAASSFWRQSNSAWVWADDPQGQESKGCFGGRIGLDAYSKRGVAGRQGTPTSPDHDLHPADPLRAAKQLALPWGVRGSLAKPEDRLGLGKATPLPSSPPPCPMWSASYYVWGGQVRGQSIRGHPFQAEELGYIG